MNILSRRERKTVISHSLSYDWEGETGWGFAFDCDEQGNVDTSKMAPAGLANYYACLAGTMRGDDGRGVVCRGVQESRHSYVQAAVGQCSCGRRVVLDGDYGDGIDCDCGRIYNSVGQELAPRSQWEPDTYEGGW